MFNVGLDSMSGSSAALVQYVVVRKDLITCLAWPLGAVIAQACHAATAVTHLFHDDDNMKTYLADLDNMHKVNSVQTLGYHIKHLH